MRLSLELVVNAEQYVGTNKKRTISLRGYKIPAIENLGATNDYFDIIDLSDNDILRIDNIPPLPHLETLVVANNRICRLNSEAFTKNLPRLKALVLTNNKLASLSCLTPLFNAPELERLSLLENPVCSKTHYRLFVIFHMPRLRYLDFAHVRDAERQAAKQLFGGVEGESLLKSIMDESPPVQTAASASLAAPQ